MAASNESGACAKACADKYSNMAACADKYGACPGSARGVVAANGAYPVVIPAAFFSETQVCPSTLVKAASCTKTMSSTCFDKAAAAMVAVSNTADPGCCKGTGVRADGKPCCGKCDKAQTAETTVATPVAEKPTGTN